MTYKVSLDAMLNLGDSLEPELAQAIADVVRKHLAAYAGGEGPGKLKTQIPAEIRQGDFGQMTGVRLSIAVSTLPGVGTAYLGSVRS